MDPGGIARVGDRTMAENIAAFKAGAVDAIQVFEPFPSLLLAGGAAYIWYVAADRGPTSYTTFYARRPLLQEDGTPYPRRPVAEELHCAGPQDRASHRTSPHQRRELGTVLLAVLAQETEWSEVQL